MLGTERLYAINTPLVKPLVQLDFVWVLEQHVQTTPGRCPFRAHRSRVNALMQACKKYSDFASERLGHISVVDDKSVIDLYYSTTQRTSNK